MNIDKTFEAIFVAVFIFFGLVPLVWLILGNFQIAVNPYVIIVVGIIVSIGTSYFLYKK